MFYFDARMRSRRLLSQNEVVTGGVETMNGGGIPLRGTFAIPFGGLLLVAEAGGLHIASRWIVAPTLPLTLSRSIISTGRRMNGAV